MVLVLPLSFASNVSERTRSAAIAKPKRKKPSPLALVNDSSVSKLSKRRLRPRTSLNSSTATTMALANKKIIVPQLKSDLGSYWTIADTSASIITGTPCRTTTSTTIVNTITAVQNIIIGARRPAVVATTVESTPSFITPHRLFFAPSPPSLQARRQVVVVEEETITPQRLLYRDGNDGSCLSYPPVLRLCSNMTGDLSRLSDRRLCPRSDTIGGTDVGDLSRPSNRILCPHPRFGMGAATPVLAVTESLNAPNSVNNDNDEDVCDHEYNREEHAKKMKKDFCQSTSQELLAWKKKNALSTKKNLSKAPQNIQDSWEKIKQICDDCLSNKLDVWVDRSGVVQINTLGGSTKYPPQMKQTRCTAIMNDVKTAASQALKLLTDNGCIFDPKKEYSKFLKPPSNHPNGRLIYMLTKEKKVGFTGRDLFQRYPHLQSLSPEEFATSVVVLFYEGMLDYAVDTELGTIVDNLVTKIVTNSEAPKYIRQLYRLYGRGGNALGMKRLLAFHLIEYGLGREHKGSGNVAEAFTCDEATLAEQVELSKAASKILSVLAEGAKGKKIRKHYASWKPGGAWHDKLSSQITAVEKINNNQCEWEDPLPNAIYPNATTADEIYACDYASTPWGQKQLQKCRTITNNGWSDNKKEGTVVIFKYNEVAFPNKGMITVAQDNGYDTMAVYNNDEIVMMRNKSNNVSSYGLIYRPAGVALTSRPGAHPGPSLLRFGTLDVMENMVASIANDKPTWDNNNNKSTFFDARYVYEAGRSNFHLGNRTNCVFGRDVITNDDVYACTQNNLPKARFGTVSKNNNRVAEVAAAAAAATTTTTTVVTMNNKRISDRKINERYRNKISQCNNDSELQIVINWIYSDSRGDDSLDGSASSRWLQLIQDYVTCPNFRNKLVEMMKHNKKSVGSSYSYVDFDMDNNEQKLMACVTSEKLFCTRDKIHTKTKTIVSIKSSPPPDGVYFLDCYATTTLRDHFIRNKRATGKTNHQNINNLRNYLQTKKELVHENYKIYTWPDDANKVQEKSKRRTPCPHKVATNTFSVFKIVDKK